MGTQNGPAKNFYGNLYKDITHDAEEEDKTLSRMSHASNADVRSINIPRGKGTNLFKPFRPSEKRPDIRQMRRS
jgi:hypothetical protein